jgi:hypothetical protein
MADLTKLESKLAEAKETEERCAEVAGSFNGKKTASLESARETRDEGTQIMETGEHPRAAVVAEPS